MTVARKTLRRLTLVTVILAFVLGGVDCSSDLFEEFSINVTVRVTKDGAGTGRVTSSDIDTGGGVTTLDCGESVFDDAFGCMIDFDDTGTGTLFLTATPDPGSVFSDPLWGGSCTPTSEDPTDCSISPANGTVALEFDSNRDVRFEVTVTFDLAPPCGADLRFEFTDSLFNAANWTSFKHFDTTPGAAATFAAEQRTDEGNPAPSRSVKHDYCGVGGIIVAHWNTAETFIPGPQAANFVTIAFDARKFPWVAGGVADMVIRVLVQQSDSYYEGPEIEVQALDLRWLNHVASCLTSENLVKRAGPGPDRPVFSQPMQFGYATANSSPTTACATGRESLVDNFFVEVR